MKYFSWVFMPTKNRRLNELIGFLIFVCAVLLFLALASYSPLDPSLNTAATPGSSHPARNWIGLFGAMLSDLWLQYVGISVFVIPAGMIWIAGRWFKSREVSSPGAKAIGATTLMVFFPALLGLLPWHWRWMHAIPVEGLLGRIVSDVLLHYFNLAGAYIVCASVIAVSLYLSTTFSFGRVQAWIETRFAFAFAGWQWFQNWREARAKKKAQKELAKQRNQKPVATASQFVPAARTSSPNAMNTAVEKMDEEYEIPSEPQTALSRQKTNDEPAIGARADSGNKSKTLGLKIAGSYKLPPSSLLHQSDGQQAVNEEELKVLANVLTSKCAEFDVTGTITQINPGPVVTTYEFKPEAGVKYSRVTSLADDLCLAMRAESILIERMAGKSTVGIQVPNHQRETIWLREVVESPEFIGNKSKLTLAMGKDINGRLITADLASMPHLLIAGSTGAGKSVAINAMIMSILYKSTPEQVRLILVDPKRLELGVYEGVPHLYVPIITEPKLASNALQNAVREMERRLKVLAEKGVRNLDQYNKLFDEDGNLNLFDEHQETEHKPLPSIVIIIDELADLMMLDQSNVEESITRLAQMARAVGIHLVLATQRPSVDVITGLIKANFPSRISFRVATKIDSRTILDCNGAECLLGKGDMLYLPSGSARVIRLHAPFVTEKETHAVVEFWRSQAQAQYEQKFLEAPKEEKDGTAGVAGEGDGEAENDELYQDAVRLVIEFGKASTSLLQRRLRIGYGRAAHLIDLMERDGIVGAADGPKPREVLKRPDWLSEVEEALR
ncbi:MAG TPA: DNA translocase FtsK [Candidatus Angelobacter sp.]|jgi:S-DNA-T family DNA segregation ATPase FtsK/SpoIIIE|nr:DNA translocase FtsK [Candidatus Angelobacter sp.]